MIEFREVSKTYTGSSHPVVRDLSFEVLDGEICVLVGPSGCGKTTSMRMVNRLIEPSSGEIFIDGEPNTAMSATQLRRRIGYAIQQIGLFPHRTIADNIATVPELVGWEKDRITTRVDELLELVGLDPEQYRGRYPAELSGGQQQRVAIARALITEPAVVFADEPTGALDTASAGAVLRLLRAAVDRTGQTIVMVTHDPVAAATADRVVFLADGRVVGTMAQPTPDAVAGQLAHLGELAAVAR